MKYAIIVDSSCDLYIDDNFTNDTFMARVPLKLRVGEKEYTDDFDLDIISLMKEMSECSEPTGTAAPSPQEWYNAFKDADEVFAVTITSALSGTYSSAMVAKNMLLENYPEKKVHIIDSKAAGSGLTLIVRKLQELIAQKMSFEEIVKNNGVLQKNKSVFYIRIHGQFSKKWKSKCYCRKTCRNVRDKDIRTGKYRRYHRIVKKSKRKRCNL